MIIGHRGAAADYPENTLPSIQAAIDAGCLMVEFDLRLTKDNVLVLMHDDKLDRTAGGKGLLREHTYAEVSKLDAGAWKDAEFADTRVPTFEEVARLCKAHGVVMMLDLKEGGLGRSIAEVIQRVGVPPGGYLIGTWDDRQLAEVRTHNPDAIVIHIGTVPKGFTDDWLDAKVNAGVAGFSMGAKELTPAFIAAAKRRGLPVYVWTVNSAETARKLFDTGVGGVITDDPKLLRESLNK
jgi:glycerophosphoryl diester phosphodiesterase